MRSGVVDKRAILGVFVSNPNAICDVPEPSLVRNRPSTFNGKDGTLKPRIGPVVRPISNKSVLVKTFLLTASTISPFSEFSLELRPDKSSSARL